MWPQNFRARLIFHGKLQNSWRCSHPEHSHHLCHSSRNTPWQGKEDSLPCLFTNICERSTVSKRADNTTFKPGRQIVRIPWNQEKKKKSSKNTHISHSATCSVCVSLLPTAQAARNTDTSLTANLTLPRLPTRGFRDSLVVPPSNDQLSPTTLHPKGRNKYQVNKLW